MAEIYREHQLMGYMQSIEEIWQTLKEKQKRGKTYATHKNQTT